MNTRRIIKLYNAKQLAVLALGDVCKKHAVKLSGDSKYIFGLDANSEPFIRIELIDPEVKKAGGAYSSGG